MNGTKKDINFEVNLLPVISLLAVLICFLLLTAVWVQVGSVDVAQALGGQPAAAQEDSPSVWASFRNDGSLRFEIKDAENVARSLRKKTIKAKRGTIHWQSVSNYLEQVKAALPEMNTVLISPEQRVSYANIVKLMDEVRKQHIRDIGINPL